MTRRLPLGTFSGMTNKQQLFVDEYLTDLNATQAAIRAGYSKKTAQVIGAENLAKPVIGDAIRTALKERRQRTEITQDRVLEELAMIAFAPGIEERLEQLKMSDQLVALDKIAKHLGMFIERVHHSGEIATTAREMDDGELLERGYQLMNRLAASMGGSITNGAEP